MKTSKKPNPFAAKPAGKPAGKMPPAAKKGMAPMFPPAAKKAKKAK